MHHCVTGFFYFSQFPTKIYERSKRDAGTSLWRSVKLAVFLTHSFHTLISIHILFLLFPTFCVPFDVFDQSDRIGGHYNLFFVPANYVNKSSTYNYIVSSYSVRPNTSKGTQTVGKRKNRT